MKDLCRKPDETRDALIEERKQDIIHQRMEDEGIVRNAIKTIQDDNVRTGVIDTALCDFFMQCKRAYPRHGIHDYSRYSEHREGFLNAADSLFGELFDRIYYDVLEDDALAQAERDVDKAINQPSA